MNTTHPTAFRAFTLVGLLVVGILGFVLWLRSPEPQRTSVATASPVASALTIGAVGADAKAVELLNKLQERLVSLGTVSAIWSETWEQHPISGHSALLALLTRSPKIPVYVTTRESRSVWFATDGTKWRLDCSEAAEPVYAEGSTGERSKGSDDYSVAFDGLLTTALSQGGRAMYIADTSTARTAVPHNGWEHTYRAILFGVPYYNLGQGSTFAYAGREFFSKWWCHRLHGEGTVEAPAGASGDWSYEVDLWITDDPIGVPVGYEFRGHQGNAGTSKWHWQIDRLEQPAAGVFLGADGWKAFWPPSWKLTEPEARTTWTLQQASVDNSPAAETFHLSPPVKCLVHDLVAGETRQTGP